MTKCVLCLELSADRATSANINSTEGRELDIRCIIKKHFSWLKVETIDIADSFICCQCLQALLAFHQFYVQVARAHNLLECDLKTAGSYEYAEQILLAEAAEAQNTEIKLEPEIIIAEVVKPKRGRGRPRKIKTVEECVRETRASRKKTASAKNQDTKIEELYVPVIKNENLDMAGTLDAVDALQTGNLSEKEEQPNEVMSSNEDFEGYASEADDRVVLNKLSKNQSMFSKKMLTSLQSDEYIATHFKLSCSICSVALDDFTALKTHFRAEHKIRGYVLCCGKKLLKRGLLVDHLHMHQNPAYFSCPRCRKELASRRCLELHLQRHGEPRERKYECEICHKKFFLRSVYSRHVLLHLPEEKKTVPCPECGKNFATEYVMKQHLRLVHLNAYAKICDVCGKTVAGREALRRHLEEHSGIPRPAIQCELCGLTLTSKYGLTRHMKAIHLEENRQPQVCPICSKVSPGIKAHKRHLNYMHNMQRKHICPMCAKAFKRPTDLKEHMTTHTGEVLYTCPHCPKTFNSNANMHSHRKKAHRKEWEEKRLQRFNQTPHKVESGNPDNTSTFSNVLELIPQNI